MRVILICSIFFMGLFATEWKIQDNPYYKHKKSQFEVLMNSDISTMMLGDSITDEGEWGELLGIKVQNRGISGDSTSGVIDRLYTISSSVKRVFIMIGVNDIMLGKSQDEVFENYKKIIKYLQDRKIEVIIQATLFVGESRMKDFNPKIEKLDLMLEDFAKSSNIAFVNLNPIFAPKKVLLKEFTSDDLHLNGKAYSIWAKEIKQYLKE